jgi:hypothetical protein
LFTATYGVLTLIKKYAQTTSSADEVPAIYAVAIVYFIQKETFFSYVNSRTDNFLIAHLSSLFDVFLKRLFSLKKFFSH